MSSFRVCRRLEITAFFFVLYCTSFTSGQERYYDYTPNKSEVQIQEYITDCKKNSNSNANYVPRISLAIQFAADTLEESHDSVWKIIFGQTGGFYKTINLGNQNGSDIDSVILQDIAGKIPDMGTYSFKILDNKTDNSLVLYYSDIYFNADPGGWIAAGGPAIEGVPDQHGFGCAGTIESDSLKLIRYRGEFMLNIHPDSILDVRIMPCRENRFDISYSFKKMNKDVISVNIYAFSRIRNQYDLIEIFCPSNTGPGETRIYKSGE